MTDVVLNPLQERIWWRRIDIEELALAASAASVAGEINSFIPALSRIPRSKFGLSIFDARGSLLSIGDTSEPFSIQSISKLFALIILMERSPDDLSMRLAFRASIIERFDSIAPLEFNRGIPSSPFLNAGALVMTDMLLDITREPWEILAQLLEPSIGGPVRINREVAVSEMETADRNRALAYYLKSFGNLRHNVDHVIEVYCQMCAIEMSCAELAVFASRLAAMGSRRRTYDHDKLTSIMLDCGLYGESLDISRRFGIPAKSGSGGGILGILPDKLGFAVWSPPLGASGNSSAGVAVLRLLGRLLSEHNA